MNMIKKLLFPAAVLLCIQFAGSTLTAGRSWNFERRQDGVTVFLRSIPGTDYKEFKGIMYVGNARLSSMVAAFDDTSSYTRWMHNCTEARLLREFNARERYTYTVTHAPWPAADRDTVVYSLLSQDPGSGTVTIAITGKADLIPRIKNRVRIPLMRALWTFKPVRRNLIMVTYQTITDPGGWLPLKLMNLSMIDLPMYTMIKFRGIIREKKYARAVYPVIREPRPGSG
jgi:hypothetical protein